ncbi:MAG: AAA family ATPase [Microcoleus sp.]
MTVALSGYQIGQAIYTGTRTLVYRGWRISDNQPVVIKFLRNAYPTFNELLQFRNQYTITKNLNSPGIIRPESLETYGNSYALVMADGGGISLREYSQTHCWELTEILDLAIQLTDILHYLSLNRIIHKDIKPANIIIHPETKQIQLIDFSIASLLPKETQEIKNHNCLEGTLAYISPEQTGRMNRGIDYRSDFYTLGVTLFELLAGKLPFRSTDPMELIHCHIAKIPPKLGNGEQATGNREEIPQLGNGEQAIDNREEITQLGNRQQATGNREEIPQLGNRQQAIDNREEIPQLGNGQQATGNREEITQLGNRQQAISNREEIPQVISKIVMKLMAKKAEDRYQSALGLKHDLETCLDRLKKTGKIAEFEIGKRDACDRFIIPEKLYGRETEVKTLLDAFERVSHPPESPLTKGGHRGVELMLVAGFSGIGKTAVVNEVHKPIVKQRGYFIKGKFDQFNRNIPFSAFVQAFRDLMGQLLSESDARLANWQTKILQALGENARVIIEVIPELERIIGRQPPVPEFSGSAAQNRFNLLFQKFIKVFATKEHSLVMFLDDLQWADSASLNLLKLLMSAPDSGYLLILGAYRDNEVFPAHPLMLTLDEIKQSKSIINKITLAPLSGVTVNQLVADTLNCNPQLSQPLTQLVYQKTQGNPFFTTQFLKALYEDGWIAFTPPTRAGTPLQGGAGTAGGWQCDMTSVRQLALTDDVVEFMALQLQKLPVQTQEVLKLGACIGNKFDLNTLAIVSEKSPISTAANLWKALQEGLIVPINETYKFFQSNDLDESDSATQMLRDRSDEIVVTYKFLHDRVQQAAYSLIPESQKQATHLKVGQALLSHTSPLQLEETIFEIVNQFNLGIAHITPQQRDRLISLNFQAGRKARLSSAYEAAARYCEIALQLLPPDSWLQDRDRSLELYLEAANSACLIGEFDRVDRLVETILSHTYRLLDRVGAIEIRIQSLVARNQLTEAIQVARKLLLFLGVELPQQPTPDMIQSALAAIGRQLEALDDVTNLQPMSDPNKLAAMTILSSMASAAYIGLPALYPLVVLKQIELSLQFGYATETAYAFSTYGLILCAFGGEIAAGNHAADLALILMNKSLERSKIFQFKAKILNLIYFFVRVWRDRLQTALAPLLEGYQAGLESGDLEFAAYCAHNHCQLSFVAGTNLDEVLQKMQDYDRAIAQLKQSTALNFHQIVYQAALNWTEPGDRPHLLMGEVYKETERIQQHQAAGDRYSVAILYVYKLMLAYHFSCPETALEIAREAEPEIGVLAGTIHLALFHFYRALTLLSNFPDASESIASDLEKLRQWSIHAPMTFVHKYDLIEAEQHRILCQKVEAIEYYDRAISGAKENGYIQEEALSNELAAKFYLDWGKEKVAAGYMQEAYYCYAKWGASAKISNLEKRYPQLLQPILQPATQPLTVLETLASISSSSSSSIHSKRTQTSSSTSINNILDFTALLKVSQALYSTIQLDELLHQLTQTILQNSGGDRCALILPDLDGKWYVKAIATLETTELCSQPLEGNLNLPVKLIQYVKNTQEVVIINDLKTDLPVIGEYLSRQQPKSILCLPILDRGHLIGILYLKNRSTSDVFTSDRIVVLKFLCTQAAISLENARLYQKEQEKTRQLERSEARFRQLIEGSADAILLFDPQSTTFTECNQAALDLMGFTCKEQLVGLTPFDISPEIQWDGKTSVEKAAELLALCFERGSLRFEWLYRRGDGKMIWVEVLLTLMSFEEKPIFQCVWRDISDRKRAEVALQEKEAEYRGIFEAVIDGLVITNLATGMPITANPAYSQMFGYSDEEILRIHPIEIIHPNSHSKFTDFLTTVRSGQEFLCEAVCLRKDGTILDVEVRANPFWYNGKNCGISVVRDVTKRKQMELLIQDKNYKLEQAIIELQQAQVQIIQSEKMSALGNLVAGVAHEINNPIGCIIGNVGAAQDYINDLLGIIDLYSEKFPDPGVEIEEELEAIDLDYVREDLPKLIKAMKDGGDRIKSISNSLRTFSRADSDSQQKFNLHEGIDSTLLILRHRLKANETRPAIEVVTDCGNLPDIACFPGQLNQVFMNILANAIDALDESNIGRSFAEIQVNPNQITIRTTVENEVVKIAIADNGKGMSEDVKSRIFDHLFTTKVVGKGTGLGLAIARQIVVEKHGGAIDVNSELGSGTEFVLTLPIN